MEKLNILHVTQYIEIGGLETLIVEICKKLDRSLFSVSILCLGGYDDKYAAGLREAGIEIQVIRKQGKFDVAFFRKVHRLVKDKKIDVLHAHSGCFLDAAIFCLLAKLNKFVFTAHGMPLSNSVQAIWEDRIAAVGCREVVAVSDEIGATLEARIPWVRNRISIILNGVDCNRFRPVIAEEERKSKAADYDLPDKAFVIGSVGRLEPVKNYPMLLRAFAGLPEELAAEPHLVLVGEGHCCSELRALAADLGVSNRVTFLGMQYRVHEILPLFDVFVLSSLTEGTSISLLEAQACGVPAVVTAVGGNSSVVREGETGFLCDVNDVAAMSQALQRLRHDSRLARRMGNAARNRVLSEFDLRTTVRRYEDLYRRASR